MENFKASCGASVSIKRYELSHRCLCDSIKERFLTKRSFTNYSCLEKSSDHGIVLSQSFQSRNCVPQYPSRLGWQSTFDWKAAKSLKCLSFSYKKWNILNFAKFYDIFKIKLKIWKFEEENRTCVGRRISTVGLRNNFGPKYWFVDRGRKIKIFFL